MGGQRKIRTGVGIGLLTFVLLGCGSAQLDEVAVENSAGESNEATTSSSSSTTQAPTTTSTSSTTSTASTTTTSESSGPDEVEVLREYMTRRFANDVDGAHELVDPEFSSAVVPWYPPLTLYEFDRWWSGPEFGVRGEVSDCAVRAESVICEAVSSNVLARAAGLEDGVVLTAEVSDGLITSYTFHNQLGSWYWDLFSWIEVNHPDETRCTDQAPRVAEPGSEEAMAAFLEDCVEHMLASVETMIAEPSYVSPGE